MGFNMVERLLEKGHEVVVFDKDEDTLQNISKKGARSANSLQSLADSLTAPRLIWVMVPYHAVDPVIGGLVSSLRKGDIIIDGGNSPYRESMRRAEQLNAKGIDFLDVGVSGGPSGARTGACVMIGGRREIFKQCEHLFRDLSTTGGYGYVGKSGSGHFVKMVHNGIEYGMMQAIAEGFALMKAAPFDLNLIKIADLYNQRSVIESRLIGWLKKAFEHYGDSLDDISGSVSHSGEGEWTVETAKELGIPVSAIDDALRFRMQSQKIPSYTGKILSALRNQFGGHEVQKKPL
jgi:6-phosphogluconate dehydrogenase